MARSDSSLRLSRTVTSKAYGQRMTDDPGVPHITIVMPSVDDFDSAVAMVRATGAHVAGSHRFVIDGPMTVEQMSYLLQIKDARLHAGTDERRFEISVDPEPSGPTDEEWADAQRWYEGWPGPEQ